MYGSVFDILSVYGSSCAILELNGYDTLWLNGSVGPKDVSASIWEIEREAMESSIAWLEKDSEMMEEDKSLVGQE